VPWSRARQFERQTGQRGARTARRAHLAADRLGLDIVERAQERKQVCLNLVAFEVDLADARVDVALRQAPAVSPPPPGTTPARHHPRQALPQHALQASERNGCVSQPATRPAPPHPTASLP
jgi:hypothetical protein